MVSRSLTTILGNASRSELIERHTLIKSVDNIKLYMANPALENNELDHVPKFGPDPFWAFVWPGSYALHRFIKADPHVVKNKNVLDFASGCGLAAITAKLNNAHAVSANDIDLYSAASIEMNASLNNVDISTTTGNLIGEDVEQDVILAGDVFYEEALGADVMKWLESQQENNNSRVFIGGECYSNSNSNL